MGTYSRSLLTGISAKSTFRKVFDFKKLKIIQYTVDIFIIFCYDYKHLPLSNKPNQPESNFTRKLYILMSCPGLLPVTV